LETLTITSTKPISLADLHAKISPLWPVEPSDDDSLVVQGASTRAYLYSSAPVGSNLFEISLDYSDVELAKSLLEIVADDADITVDNDFGTILPGNEFLSRCKTEKGWDWRRP